MNKVKLTGSPSLTSIPSVPSKEVGQVVPSLASFLELILIHSNHTVRKPQDDVLAYISPSGEFMVVQILI